VSLQVNVWHDKRTCTYGNSFDSNHSVWSQGRFLKPHTAFDGSYTASFVAPAAGSYNLIIEVPNQKEAAIGTFSIRR